MFKVTHGNSAFVHILIYNFNISDTMSLYIICTSLLQLPTCGGNLYYTCLESV